MTSVAFTVHGVAAPAGSKKGFYNAKARRVIITDDSARSRPWKALVADAAVENMLTIGTNGSRVLEGRPLLQGPLKLSVTFYLPRPKGHFGARGLKPSAPIYPTVKPDVTKLLRAVEDALTGIVWRDDAQIVSQFAQKVYGEPARTEIHISQKEEAA